MLVRQVKLICILTIFINKLEESSIINLKD